jgi:hypothetical protein
VQAVDRGDGWLTVAKHRERIVDRSIGVLTKNATVAVKAIARLIKDGESDSIKLSAAKSLLDKLKG